MDINDLAARLDRIEAALAAPPREYVNTAEAAEFVGLSRQTLEIHRMERSGPPFIRVGSRVLYSLRDLRTYMEAHRLEPLR